tara:strand:+ start:14918 stop:15571 length:654 start_codon:yes stop_codon:yes gene_type:complete
VEVHRDHPFLEVLGGWMEARLDRSLAGAYRGRPFVEVRRVRPLEAVHRDHPSVEDHRDHPFLEVLEAWGEVYLGHSLATFRPSKEVLEGQEACCQDRPLEAVHRDHPLKGDRRGLPFVEVHQDHPLEAVHQDHPLEAVRQDHRDHPFLEVLEVWMEVRQVHPLEAVRPDHPLRGDHRDHPSVEVRRGRPLVEARLVRQERVEADFHRAFRIVVRNHR